MPVHDHLTLGKVLLPLSSNETRMFTRHILRENVRPIHGHDLHHCLSRQYTCTYLQFLCNHLWQLGNIFKWLHHNNLQVHTKKSSFCTLKIKYLGFILTREGIELQQQKVNAILQVAQPCNVKQVWSFIGMLSHYKAMIPHCSHLLTLLTALTKKKIKFEWTTELSSPTRTSPFPSTSTLMPQNSKSDPSLPKRTSHLHFIQGNLPILKQDTPSQNSNCLQ